MATTSTSSMSFGLGLGQVGYHDPSGPSSASTSYHPQQQAQHPLHMQQQQQRPQAGSFPFSNGEVVPDPAGPSHLGHPQNGVSRPAGLHIDTANGNAGEYAQAHTSGQNSSGQNTGFEHLTASLPPTHPYLGHQQQNTGATSKSGMTSGQVAYQNQALPMGYPPNGAPLFAPPSAAHPQTAQQHLFPSQPHLQQQHPGQPMPGFTFGNPPPLPPHWTNGAIPGPSTVQMLPVAMGGMPPPPPPGYMDWDDGDYLDGGDMIYGQLEVSPGSTPVSSMLSSPLQDPLPGARYASTLPSPVSPILSLGFGQIRSDQDIIMEEEELPGQEQLQEQTRDPMVWETGQKRKAQVDLKVDAATRKVAKGNQGGLAMQVAPLGQDWITPEQLLSSSSITFPSVPPPSTPASPFLSLPPLFNVLNHYPSPVSPPQPGEVTAMPRFMPRPPTPLGLGPMTLSPSSARYSVRNRSASPDHISPVQVKHRRRTTPEQLKVLEHWFDINPKPDNSLREWLAMELGMKRNVQVWFQNRRAKVKGLAIKEKAAAAKAAQDAAQNETVRTPENGPGTPPNPTIPPAPGGPITRPEITPSPEQTPSSQQLKPDQTYPLPPAAATAAETNASGSKGPAMPDHPSLASALAIQPPPHRPTPLHIQSQPTMSTTYAANNGVPHSALPLPSQQSSLLPPVHALHMGRRASLANGEAAKMDAFMAKQRLAARKASAGLAGYRQGGLISPVRSPVMAGVGMANMARRTSGPYPPSLSLTPNGALEGLQAGYGGPGSPKISPNVRPTPSALHLAAMRNNSRRASMPGVAGQPGAAGIVQLISSGPFTPPRVVSGAGFALPGNGNNANRELSPIKDHEDGLGSSNLFVFPESTDLATTYLTPPSSTYLPTPSGATYLSDSSSASYDLENVPFTPAGPGPAPGFSFGSAGASSASSMPPIGEAGSAQQQQIAWMEMQPRGRLGSIASVETYTTDGGATVDGISEGWSEWMGAGLAQLQQQQQHQPGANGFSGGLLGADLAGFNPEARRASAPADLLHDLHLGAFPGVAGTNTTPHRPSPLGNNFAADPFAQTSSYDTAASYSNSANGIGASYPMASGGGYSYPMIDFASSNDTSSTGSGSLDTSPIDRPQPESARSQNGKPTLNLSAPGMNGQRSVQARQQQMQPQLQQAGSGDSADSGHAVMTPFSSNDMANGFMFSGLPTSGSVVSANGDKEYDWFSAVDGGELNV